MNCFNLLCFIILEISLLANKAQSLEAQTILNGHDLLEASYMYQVSVQVANVPKCGGGLLSLKMAISAASCFVNENTWELLNEYFSILIAYNALYPEENSQRRDVYKVYISKAYQKVVDTSYLAAANIVVAEVSVAFDMTGNPTPVPLNILYTAISNLTKRKFKIMGHGFHAYIDPAYQANNDTVVTRVWDGNLRYGAVYVLSTVNCVHGHNITFAACKFCAEVKQYRNRPIQATTQLEIGSPLVFDENKAYGILTASISEYEGASIPGLYTRILTYRELISNILSGQEDTRIITAILARNATHQ